MSIAKSKLNTYLFMHHKIKRDRRSKEKPPLAWTYSFSRENILGFKEIYTIIFET